MRLAERFHQGPLPNDLSTATAAQVMLILAALREEQPNKVTKEQPKAERSLKRMARVNRQTLLTLAQEHNEAVFDGRDRN